MSDFGHVPDISGWADDDVIGSDYFRQVVASATPNTKGAWVEVTPATYVDITTMYISMLVGGGGGTPNTPTGVLLDIGIGAAGSEVVLVPDIWIHGCSFYNEGRGITIPISVGPAGTRIAYRTQSNVASADTYIKMLLAWSGLRANNLAGQRAEAQGVNLSTTYGTQLVAGSSHAKGSWVQIASSTGFQYTGMLICFGADDEAGDRGFGVDIGIGSAGNEVAIIENIYLIIESASTPDGFFHPSPAFIYFPLCVAAGSRISGRCKSGTNGNTIPLSIVGFA